MDPRNFLAKIYVRARDAPRLLLRSALCRSGGGTNKTGLGEDRTDGPVWKCPSSANRCCRFAGTERARRQLPRAGRRSSVCHPEAGDTSHPKAGPGFGRLRGSEELGAGPGFSSRKNCCETLTINPTLNPSFPACCLRLRTSASARPDGLRS